MPETSNPAAGSLPARTDAGIVVIGGGISGLAVAWFLRRRGARVTVLEAQPAWGGLIATSRIGGYLIEHGPNSTLQKPGRADDAIGRMIDRAGLGSAVVDAGRTGNRRYVMRRGRLLALPTSPPAFLTSSLFSWPAKLRLLAEPLIGRSAEDETIADFVTRRLGAEFLTYAIQPFVSGVFAGDAARLSVRAAVPRIWDLEQRYGSLVRGALALGRATRNAGMPAGRLISFDRGMAALPEALAAALPAGSGRTGCRVVALEPGEGGWTIRWQAGSVRGSFIAATVILATAAPSASMLLEPISAEAARLLRGITYAPIVSVAAGFDRSVVRHPLDGFGFLIPRAERRRTLGALFSSTLFPGRAPDGKVLLTAFIGGTTDPEIATLDDEALTDQVLADLAAALGVAGRPELVRLSRYPRAIPQYVIGHAERVERIAQLLRPQRGLHVCASWRDGVSVGDCIRNAERLAASLTEAGIAIDASVQAGFEGVGPPELPPPNKR